MRLSFKGGVETDVRLRPHHLLCIQGFRGQGYSPNFVANMARIIDRLTTRPDITVRIVSGADDVCEACPHLDAGNCGCPDQNVDELDLKVLSKLGFSTGDICPWNSIVDVVHQKIDRDQLNFLCPDCRWNDFDFCANGIDSMQAPAGASEDHDKLI